MERLNVVGLETPAGYRTFELYRGDITQLGCEVDAVVISAFRNGYVPTPGSVVGAFHHRLNLSVADLAKNPALDLREALGVWISHPVTGCEFKRVVCVEIVGRNASIDDALQNAFVGLSVLEAKGIEVRQVALPILGSGQQLQNSGDVMGSLLKHARAYLQRSPCVQRVMFVEFAAEKASALDTAMNVALRRSKVVIPKGQLIVGIRAELVELIDRSLEYFDSGEARLLNELRAVLDRDDARSFELGVCARKFAERMSSSFLQGQLASQNLDSRIRDLGKHGIAIWIQQYLHVLRVFGNESAHEKTNEKRSPAFIEQGDLAVCLMCLQALMHFWRDWRAGSTQTADGII